MTRYPGYGGIETVTSLILSRLMTDVGKVEISILAHLSETNPQCFTEGVMIYTMPDAIDAWTEKNYNYANRIISKGEFDAIIYQDSYGRTEQIVCPLAKRYNIPLFVFEHNSPLFVYNKRGLDPITTPKGFLRRVLHPYLLYREIKRKRLLLDHCEKYVLLSKAFIPEFCHLIRTERNNPKVTYINNPCKTIEYQGNVTKQKIILCVCQLNKTKQVDRMLELWKRINPQIKEWIFQIVGDGDEMEHLKRIVSNESIPRVEFIGYADPAPYYQQASIFWMMSKFEGWGMTLVEGMQCGCVPIAWESYSSLKDIIDNGINGFVVKNEDSLSFGEKTLVLARDEALFQKMSQSAREKSKYYSLDRIAGEWMKLLGI